LTFFCIIESYKLIVDLQVKYTMDRFYNNLVYTNVQMYLLRMEMSRKLYQNQQNVTSLSHDLRERATDMHEADMVSHLSQGLLANRIEYVNIVCNLCKLLFITEDTIKYSLYHCCVSSIIYIAQIFSISLL
jgi:hypothetical protein